MSFVLYDLIFLVLFTLAVALFLYKRRHNLKRDGLLYLYRTKWGIKFIESTTKKFPKLLKSMQYLIVASGYTLMIAMFWLLIKFTYFYLQSPYAAKALKVPVIMPLIPYLPDLFKIDYLPPFYFTYWIIIIAIIAIPHEFAHGIFARLNKIKILSTGFGFLGPFLAAFVEQDEKQMKKASKFSQLSVLAAGTFANIVVALLFTLILWMFFASAFVPAGVNFNTYSIDIVNVSSISAISLVSIGGQNFSQLEANNRTYFASPESIASLNKTSYILAYDDSPAFRVKLSGAITEINNQKITNYNELNSTLHAFKPGDNVTITTQGTSAKSYYNITLGERDSRAFLGIGVIPSQGSGILGNIFSVVSKIKDPSIYYESKFGDFGIFIMNLLWWLVLISFSVGLMNMLPAGLFDGGRFFYLTIWAITKKEKIAKWAFKLSTWFLLALVALMIVKWLFAIL